MGHLLPVMIADPEAQEKHRVPSWRYRSRPWADSRRWRKLRSLPTRLVRVKFSDRHAVPVAAVAFAEPPVMQDRHAGALKRHRRCLDRSAKVRREGGADPVVSASPAELTSQRSTPVGQASRVPPSRDPAVVVLTR
jgi:hypothetical protein